MKRAFYTGLLFFLPVGITIWLLVKILEFLSRPFLGIANTILQSHISLQFHQTLAQGIAHLLSLFLLICAIFLLGFLGRKFFAFSFDRLVTKLPLAGWIYRTSREIANAMLDPSSKLFKQTLLVPYPHHNAFALGFLVGDPPPHLRQYSPTSDIVVFVPTFPYSIAGFLLLYPKKSIHPSNLSISEGWRFLLAQGTSSPSKG